MTKRREVKAQEFSAINLGELYQRTPVRRLTSDDRIVIFSDLHMGNGSRTDDFVHNGNLFSDVIRNYYAPSDYHLILNGDVEDLQRHPMKSIVRRWPQVYHALREVSLRGGITRIVGNHDIDLLEGGPSVTPLAMSGHESWPETFMEEVYEGLRLNCDSGELFVFHGHQSSRWYEKHNDLIRLLLRYIANPLRIGNRTVAADSRKQFHVEQRAYEFATAHKIMAVIGHTHRPLFESMSKVDALQFEIERLCRKYPKSKKPGKIEKQIGWLKTELMESRSEEPEENDSTSLYREHLLVPSMFNSGCVLGKRGMTCLEIEAGKLRLVYWYDTTRKQKYIQYRADSEEELSGTPYRRTVIKQDSLEYIFSRIRLLA
ncbi:MAG: metallophosphoesterase [Alkalispirochaeta sp.]